MAVTEWESCRLIAWPPDAGAPTDIVRYRDSLVVLTEWALFKLQGQEASVLLR